MNLITDAVSGAQVVGIINGAGGNARAYCADVSDVGWFCGHLPSEGERGPLCRDAFGKGGYEAVSLAEIARLANATTGTLYHHFSDKRALFTAVADSIVADVVRHLAANAPATDDLWELVLYAVDGSLAYAARPGVARVIFKDAPTVIGTSEWRTIEMRHGFGTMQTLLTKLHQRGELYSEPSLVAAIILGALIQIVDAVLVSRDPNAALDAGRDAMERVVAAFRVQP